MKTLGMVRLKLLINLFLFLSTIYIKSQEIKTFYFAQDRVKIDNPVVISVKGNYQLFLTSENNISNNINIERLILAGKMFLYNDNTLFWDLMPEEKRILLGSCLELSRVKTIKNKYTVFKLSKNVTYFYLGFTTLREYNNRMKNSEGNNYFKDNYEQFYPIFFPICNN